MNRKSPSLSISVSLAIPSALVNTKLVTANIPILSDLKGWKYGFESPFKADLYYVITRIFSGNKWGTAKSGDDARSRFWHRSGACVRHLRFSSIVEPRMFLKEVAGTDDHFRLDEFADVMRSRIVSVFSEALATAKIPVLDVASRHSEVGDAILPILNSIMQEKYGLELTSFVVENVSVPPEVEQAIDKRSSMAAVGNLNDYVKFQMAQGMEKGGAGIGGAGAELAVGLAMAQQMMNQAGGILNQSTPTVTGAPSASTTTPLPDLLGIADVAKLLGVSEEDVMATITAGDLKAKKIGSTYRITRTAVEVFLKT